MKNSKLKPFRTTTLIFGTSILILIVALAAYAFLLRTVGTVENHIASLQEETKGLEAQEAAVGELKKNLTTTKESEDTLSSYFIDAGDIVPFLETVEGYGRATNIVVTFSTVDIKKGPDQLAVSLTANGAFPDLYRFMALLESAPYEFVINNVDLQSVTDTQVPAKGKSPRTNIWEANINLSVLSLSGVSGAPKP